MLRSTESYRSGDSITQRSPSKSDRSSKRSSVIITQQSPSKISSHSSPSKYSSGTQQEPSKNSSRIRQSFSKRSNSLRSGSILKSLKSNSKKTVSSKETVKGVEYAERPQWEIDEERRKKELVEFLEDLGNSEEFQQFLIREKHMKRVEKDKKDGDGEMQIEEVKENEKYPLTIKSILEKKKIIYHENLFKSRINEQKLYLQDEYIKKIRQVIALCKKSFYCHIQERETERQKQLDLALEKLQQHLKINIIDLYLIKDRIPARLLCCNKIRRFHNKLQKDRKIAIIEKLLREYERQRQINKMINKTYHYKIPPNERVVNNMEIVGFRIPFPEESQEEIIEQEDEKNNQENIVLECIENLNKAAVKEFKKREKGAKGNKHEKTDRKTKKQKTKEPKKEKKRKSMESQKFTVPQIPKVNERNNVVPYEHHRMEDFINDLTEMDGIEQQNISYKIELIKKHRPEAPEDTLTVVTPKEIIFKGYKNGMIYKRRFTILNGSNYTKKYKIYGIDQENEMDPKLIQIDNLGIKQLAPGIQFSGTITFSPLNLEKYFIATIIFLTYYTETGEKFQFSIPVQCIPLYSQIIIIPEKVSFESSPVWVAQKRCKNEKFKIFTFKNCGTRASIITIKKIFDPLHLESGADVHENFIQCIVENVFNYFEFENYILELPPESERVVKVFFKNVDHIGFYYEKYSVDVYEKIDVKNDKFLGCQEISLTAETTGHYITVTPENLDFGLCVFNSVYQLPVSIKNNDKLPHSLLFRFPKCLPNNIRASPNSIILQAQQKTFIFLKLIPRKINIIEEDNPYYDEDLNLLKFPVHIHVDTEKNSSILVPHIKIMLFAALYQPLSLMLKPIRRSRTSISETVSSFIIGECTTNETVYGKISITNDSDVVQHFGFLNLPQNVIIMPNYGFGTVEPLQTVILAIMFSAQFEDIPEIELIPMKTCYNIHFNIVVDTIKNLGGIQQFVDYKRINQLLKKIEHVIESTTTDPPILREVYHLHYLLIKNQYDYFKTHLQAEEMNQLEKIKSAEATDEQKSLVLENKITSQVTNSEQKSTVEMKTSKLTIAHSTSKSLKSNVSAQISLSLLPEKKDFYQYFGLPNPLSEETKDSLTDSAEEKTKPNEESTIVSFNFPKVFECNQNKLQIEATIVAPLCQFSHQFIAFPSTPTGSYSIMTLELCALTNPFNLQCNCGYLQKKYPELFLPIDYEAEFEIVAIDLKQFIIEPTCGILKSGERKKITVIAKPEIPTDIIEDQAKAIKIEEVRKQLADGLMEVKTSSVGRKKKERYNKKEQKLIKNKIEKNKNDSISEIDVPNNLVVLNYLDYFPAEMCVWRSLEPYTIENDFVCKIRYHNCDIDRKTERLLMKATCKVVKPDFVTNLKTQHFHFGTVAVDTTATEYITVQNITNVPIKPSLTLLQPTGPFYCPDLKKIILGPEASIKFPITFTPLYENLIVEEYAEIRAGKTICPLKISGKGVAVYLTMNPQFLVYRVEAQRGGKSLINFDLYNDTETKVEIKFIKTHELEGEMMSIEKPKANKADNTKAIGKKSSKSSSSSKRSSLSSKSSRKQSMSLSKKDKKRNKPKHSMELTEDEQYSLKKFFKSRNEESYFYADKFVTIEAKNKISVKVRFGNPEELKTDKKTAIRKQSNVSQRGSLKNEPKKYYVAKYNILLGNQIWRDFIIIASFK